MAVFYRHVKEILFWRTIKMRRDEQFVKQIKFDEGVKNDVYLDSLGLKTVGVGHLIKEVDGGLEKLEVGDTITDEKVEELLLIDLHEHYEECKHMWGEDVFHAFPGEIQHVLLNMMFNMGQTRLSGFKKMLAALEKGDYAEMAVQMMDSKWATQVGPRATRLRDRVVAVGKAIEEGDEYFACTGFLDFLESDPRNPVSIEKSIDEIPEEKRKELGL